MWKALAVMVDGEGVGFWIHGREGVPEITFGNMG